MPVYYECQRCTACCRWPGVVRVDGQEVERMASHLAMPVLAFTERYTRLADNRRGLCLVERADGRCVFLEGGDCRVQAVKPQQCRDFPNLWRHPGFEERCRAVGRTVGVEEYEQLIRAATGREGWRWDGGIGAGGGRRGQDSG